jgi:RNA polymerase sigma-70 factor, ECF subfamily
MLDDNTRIFEQHRPTIEGIAYRMLGSLADAQDVVQETYIKWKQVQLRDIDNPRAWLITVSSRLALNGLQSAKTKRENYFGVWLPEPLIDEAQPDASKQLEIDESVSVALLLALERLSPAERAVYILKEVFALSYQEIGAALGKSNDSCRKLGSRARVKIQKEGRQFVASTEEHYQLLESFIVAAQAGDLNQFKKVLSASVELYTDGGGKAQAVKDVLLGSKAIARFFTHIWAAFKKNHIAIGTSIRWYNGSPGMLISENGEIASAMTFDIKNGCIQNIYAIRNPDKLKNF